VRKARRDILVVPVCLFALCSAAEPKSLRAILLQQGLSRLGFYPGRYDVGRCRKPGSGMEGKGCDVPKSRKKFVLDVSARLLRRFLQHDMPNLPEDC